MSVNNSKVTIHYNNGDIKLIECVWSKVKESFLEASWYKDECKIIQYYPLRDVMLVEIESKPNNGDKDVEHK